MRAWSAWLVLGLLVAVLLFVIVWFWPQNWV